MGDILAISDSTDFLEGAYMPSPFKEFAAVTPGVIADMFGDPTPGSNDKITTGQKFVVPKNRAVFIYNKAEFENLITDPGTYEYRKSDNGMKNISGASVSHIAYITLSEIRDLKYGTEGLAEYPDMYYGLNLEIRSFGTYSIQITNPETFIVNFLPYKTSNYSLDEDSAQEIIKPGFLTSFLNACTAMSGQYRIDDFTYHMDLMQQTVAADPEAVAQWPERYGFTVARVLVKNIKYSSNSIELIKAAVRRGMIPGESNPDINRIGQNVFGGPSVPPVPASHPVKRQPAPAPQHTAPQAAPAPAPQVAPAHQATPASKVAPQPVTNESVPVAPVVQVAPAPKKPAPVPQAAPAPAPKAEKAQTKMPDESLAELQRQLAELEAKLSSLESIEPVAPVVSATAEAVTAPVEETVAQAEVVTEEPVADSQVEEIVPEPVEEINVEEVAVEPVEEEAAEEVAVEAIEEAPVEEAAEPVEEVAEAVEEAPVEEAAEPVEEVAEAVEEAPVEETAEPVEEVAEAVEEAPVEEAAEPVEEVAEAVEEAPVEEVAEPVAPAVEEVTDAVEEQVAEEEVEDSVEEVVLEEAPVVDEAIAAAEAVEEVAEPVEEAVEEAAEPVEEAVEEVAEEAPVEEVAEEASAVDSKLNMQLEFVQKLNELYQAGVLTKEEFDAKKKEVLGL